MARPLTTAECRELNAAIKSGELVESEEAGLASAEETLRLVAMSRSMSARQKPREPRPYKPRSEDAKAIVELLDKGVRDYDKIARRTMTNKTAVRKTAERWRKGTKVVTVQKNVTTATRKRKR